MKAEPQSASPPSISVAVPPDDKTCEQAGKRIAATREELVDLMIETEQEQKTPELEGIDGSQAESESGATQKLSD